MDTVDLLAADYPRRRRSDHGRPADEPSGYRGRFVLGLEGTDLTPGQRRTISLAVKVPFTLQMAAAWSAAINGVFRTGASSLPILPLAIFLPMPLAAVVDAARDKFLAGACLTQNENGRVGGGATTST